MCLCDRETGYKCAAHSRSKVKPEQFNRSKTESNQLYQLDTLQLAIKLIAKGMAENAYNGIAMPNAPEACIKRLQLMMTSEMERKL